MTYNEQLARIEGALQAIACQKDSHLGIDMVLEWVEQLRQFDSKPKPQKPKLETVDRFRPKHVELYWSINRSGVFSYDWYSGSIDLLRYSSGLVFRTKEEAERHGPAILAKIREDFEKGGACE